MIRLQIAPDVEFKLEIEVEGVDASSRDFDIQQIKTDVYKEFEARLRKAFPEGFQIDTFEFGLDRGWHEDLEKIS